MSRVTSDTVPAFIARFLTVCLLMLGILLAFAPGCDEQGAEGDRCNPYLSHNDCNGGLVCAGHPPSSVVIPFCQENFCCPLDSSGRVSGTNPNCQPGCNGSAAVVCADTMDPGACLVSEGGSVAVALALDDAGDSSIASLLAESDAQRLDSTAATSLGTADSATAASPGSE